jgi:hypothetical protein
VPAGNPDAGQWTDDGGFPTDISAQSRNGSGSKPPLKITVRPRPGMGHNNGPALENPPEVPPEEPRSRQARSAVVRGIARWAAAVIKLGFTVAFTLPAIQGASWIARYLPAIRSYSDPPRTLDELHDAVSHPRPGYEIHHNVEQTSAEEDGFPRSMIDGRDNLVRIPTLKHHEISGWYQRGNRDFGGLSPREYLRGKSWGERRQVGLRGLRKFGVLTP